MFCNELMLINFFPSASEILIALIIEAVAGIIRAIGRLGIIQVITFKGERSVPSPFLPNLSKPVELIIV